MEQNNKPSTIVYDQRKIPDKISLLVLTRSITELVGKVSFRIPQKIAFLWENREALT